MLFMLTTLIVFLLSLYHFLRKRISKIEFSYYLSWFLLLHSVIYTADYASFFSESIEFSIILFVYVLISVIPILFYCIVNSYRNTNNISESNFYFPIIVLFLNVFFIVYFHMAENPLDETYIIIDNLMTYSNYIIALIVFPALILFYSYKSYKLISPIEVFSSKSLSTVNDYLFLFVVLFNINIIFWFIGNYITTNNILIWIFKVISLISFVGSYLVLSKINKVASINGSKDLEQKIDYDAIQVKITNAVEKERLFLDKNLTVKYLAKYINSNEKYVSYAINKFNNKNFSNYINEFRVEFAKKALLSSEYRNFTIEAISELSGFNSKSGFNSTFKKFTGKTPTQFQKSSSS